MCFQRDTLRYWQQKKQQLVIEHNSHVIKRSTKTRFLLFCRMEGALVLVMSLKLLVMWSFISFTGTFINNSLFFKHDKFLNQKHSLAKYYEINIQITWLSPPFLNTHDANCKNKETNNLKRNGFVFINDTKTIYMSTGLYPENWRSRGSGVKDF